MKRFLGALVVAWLAVTTPAAAATVIIDFEEFTPGQEAPAQLGPLVAGGAYRIAAGLPSGLAAHGYVAPGSADAGLFLIGEFLFDSVDLLAPEGQDITFTFYNFDTEAGSAGSSFVFRPGMLDFETFLFPSVDFVPNFTMVTSSGDFYLDNLNGRLPVMSAVPEPAGWAMMIVGFGIIGTSLRRVYASRRIYQAT